MVLNGLFTTAEVENRVILAEVLDQIVVALVISSLKAPDIGIPS